MIYDLHTHSNVSDGILAPHDLVCRAKEQGVDVLALTDHDTLAGLPAARVAAESVGLHLINGIELSTLWAGRGVHIVGLNVDCESAILLEAVEAQSNARLERAHRIGEKLAKAGVADAFEGASRFAEGENLGRPHFAKYLVEAGYVANFQSAFRQYLGAGKVGDVKQLWLPMSQVIAAITAAGGVAVLAHPLKYELTRTKLCTLLDAFRAEGGEAVEVVSGGQTLQETQSLALLSQQFGLFASCGSDFHMPGQSWQELGKATRLPDTCRPVWQQWA